MKSPAFQFYPADFLSSGKVGQMTPIEVGIYVLLLCLDWSDGGFVFDIPRLARWCRTDEPTFMNGWDLVGLCFVEEGGRWFNPRLRVERLKQEEWREKSRIAGVKSGRARRKAANQPSQMVGTKREPNVNTPTLLTPISPKEQKLKGSRKVSLTKRDPAGDSNFASNGDAAKKRTWLSPIADVWNRRFGPDTFPFKQHAKALAELYRRGEPPPEVARRLENYLAVTDAQYLSVPKFVQTYGEWATANGAKRHTNGSDKLTESRANMVAWMEKP